MWFTLGILQFEYLIPRQAMYILQNKWKNFSKRKVVAPLAESEFSVKPWLLPPATLETTVQYWSNKLEVEYIHYGMDYCPHNSAPEAAVWSCKHQEVHYSITISWLSALLSFWWPWLPPWLCPQPCWLRTAYMLWTKGKIKGRGEGGKEGGGKGKEVPV